jgi:hypothetical protein
MVTKYGMQRYTVIVLSYLVVFIFFIPVMILSRKFEGESIFSIFYTRCKPLFFVVSVPFSIILIYGATLTSTRLEFFITNTLMNTMTCFVAILLFTSSAVYGVTKGISSMMRIAPLILIIFTGSIIISAVILFKELKFEYLYPAFIDTPSTFWLELQQEIAKNGELLIFLVFCRHIDKKAHRGILLYVPFVLFMTLFARTFCMVILGPGMDVANFPYNRVAAMVNFVVVERIDGLDMFNWIVAAILKIVMFMTAIKEIINFAVKERAAKIVTTVLTIISGLVCWYFSVNHHLLMIWDFSQLALPVFCLFLVVCPIIAIIMERKKQNYEQQKNKKENASGLPDASS